MNMFSFCLHPLSAVCFTACSSLYGKSLFVCSSHVRSLEIVLMHPEEGGNHTKILECR